MNGKGGKMGNEIKKNGTENLRTNYKKCTI